MTFPYNHAHYVTLYCKSLIINEINLYTDLMIGYNFHEMLLRT